MAEDRFEVIDPLLRVSKEGAFALFEDEVELIPQDLDEIPLEAATLDDKQDDRRYDEGEEQFESEGFDKTHDPVRLYLREMGAVRLLNREGEIEIARRIERGLTRMRRTLSRCPLVIQKMVEIAEDVRSGLVPAREILQCNDPLPTDEVWQAAANELYIACDQLAILRRRFLQLRQKLVAVPRQTKPKQNRHLRWELGRLAVEISRLACGIRFQNSVLKSLIVKLSKAADEIKPVEHQLARIQRSLETSASISVDTMRELRREQRTLFDTMQHLEDKYGSPPPNCAARSNW